MMIKVSIEEYNQRLAELPTIKNGKDKEETTSTKTTTKMIEKKPCLNHKKSSEKAPISEIGYIQTEKS